MVFSTSQVHTVVPQFHLLAKMMKTERRNKRRKGESERGAEVRRGKVPFFCF